MNSKETQWLLEEKYNGQKCAAFLADCARLRAGEPLAYIIGWVPFLDCVIWLDSKPLIPRSETEYWVQTFIAYREDSLASLPKVTQGRELRVLDMCAGSGCIGVAVAKALSHIHVDFAEIDTAHHPTISRNCYDNLTPTVAKKSQIFAGDLFALVPSDTKYDFILSNPPYIDPALDRTETSVKNHEPHQALYGGTSGTEIIARLIAQAPQYLTPNGELWLEHEPEQTTTLTALADEHRFTIRTHHDQYGYKRWIVLMLQ